MLRIREVSTRVYRFLFGRQTGTGRDVTNDELKDIAECVMGYARMRADESPTGILLVEVDELAFRFREEPRLIRKALHLLEHDRRAQKTEFDGLWKLHPNFGNVESRELLSNGLETTVPNGLSFYRGSGNGGGSNCEETRQTPGGHS